MEQQPTAPLQPTPAAPARHTRHSEHIVPCRILLGIAARRTRRRPVAAESPYRRAIAQRESSDRGAQGSIATISEGYIELLREQGRTGGTAAVGAKGR